MKWQDLTDEQLFETGGEQPGSQRSYERDVEVKRRTYMMEKRTSEAQIEAARSQKLAADATVETARWTKYSAITVGVSVVVAVVGVLL
ncbi:MAG: hypothetical protein ACK4PN_15145 [Allorhizobium sp.]